MPYHVERITLQVQKKNHANPWSNRYVFRCVRSVRFGPSGFTRVYPTSGAVRAARLTLGAVRGLRARRQPARTLLHGYTRCRGRVASKSTVTPHVASQIALARRQLSRRVRRARMRDDVAYAACFAATRCARANVPIRRCSACCYGSMHLHSSSLYCITVMQI